MSLDKCYQSCFVNTVTTMQFIFLCVAHLVSSCLIVQHHDATDGGGVVVLIPRHHSSLVVLVWLVWEALVLMSSLSWHPLERNIFRVIPSFAQIITSQIFIYVKFCLTSINFMCRRFGYGLLCQVFNGLCFLMEFWYW